MNVYFITLCSLSLAPLETWLGLSASLDRLVNNEATHRQISAAKGGKVYSTSLAKVERSELARESDKTITYWLRMAAYVFQGFSLLIL